MRQSSGQYQGSLRYISDMSHNVSPFFTTYSCGAPSRKARISPFVCTVSDCAITTCRGETSRKPINAIAGSYHLVMSSSVVKPCVHPHITLKSRKMKLANERL